MYRSSGMLARERRAALSGFALNELLSEVEDRVKNTNGLDYCSHRQLWSVQRSINLELDVRASAGIVDWEQEAAGR